MGGENMTRRIVVPVLDERGLTAQLSQHFGRAPYFAVVDIGDDNQVLKQQTIANDSEHFGGVGRPPDRILQLKPDALITYGMGPRALTIFQDARVAVLRTAALIVEDVVTLYNNETLEELTEGCLHAQHH
jgi:predicted Fe-Mo cluster-binding NifX family protein